MQVRRLAELETAVYHRLMQRSAADVQRVLPQVQTIMEDVRQRGDAAVREYSAELTVTSTVHTAGLGEMNSAYADRCRPDGHDANGRRSETRFDPTLAGVCPYLSLSVLNSTAMDEAKT